MPVWKPHALGQIQQASNARAQGLVMVSGEGCRGVRKGVSGNGGSNLFVEGLIPFVWIAGTPVSWGCLWLFLDWLLAQHIYHPRMGTWGV